MPLSDWPYARNSARGPTNDQAIAAPGAAINWTAIDSGAANGSTVPITPKVTGRIRVSAAITLLNAAGADDVTSIQLLVGGVAQSVTNFTVTVPKSGNFTNVAFSVNINLPVNVSSNVGIKIVPTTGVTVPGSNSSALNLDELNVTDNE